MLGSKEGGMCFYRGLCKDGEHTVAHIQRRGSEKPAKAFRGVCVAVPTHGRDLANQSSPGDTRC